MKKILLALLFFIIFAMFAILVNASPVSYGIHVSGENELDEMRSVIYANDEEFMEYLENSNNFLPKDLRSREAIISALKIIDSLPILYISGAKFRDAVHVFDLKSTVFVFQTEFDERYQFRISGISHDSIEYYAGGEISLIYENQEHKIKIYCYSDLEKRFRLDSEIHFPVQLDGHFAILAYQPRNSERNWEMFLEDMKENMTIISLSDEPWRTALNTSDALIVLRAVAGIAELTDWQAVRFGIENAPTSADALRILRAVAGL